jgi:hypothetical protein
MADKAVGTIYSSTDYGKFQFTNGQRNIRERHLANLVQSLEEYPELSPSLPILVNDKFDIIDGQHRYEASKTLERPVYYIQSANTNIDSARQINSSQVGWKLRDYLDSYVATGHDQYVEVAKLTQEYPVSLTVLLQFMANTTSHEMLALFKVGKFKLADDMPAVLKKLDKLKSLSAYCPFWVKDNFGFAFFKIVRNETYDNDRMLNKLSQTTFDQKASITENLREFERVYNYHTKDAGLARLF